MIDLADLSLSGHRTVQADEAASLGLPRESHGLFLLTADDDSHWCLATADMEFYVMCLSGSGDIDLHALILRTGGKTWRLLFGWPPLHVGYTPDLPDPVRD